MDTPPVMIIEQPDNAIVPIDAARTRAYIDAATAPNTRRAYRSDWEHFTRWCAAYGLTSLPATTETVALYLGTLVGVAKVSTVQRRLTAIAKAHRAAGYETPTKSEAVHLTMRGIRRTHGVAPDQKVPAVLADLRAMLAVLPTTLIGTRDRALLLGFAATSATANSSATMPPPAPGYNARDRVMVMVLMRKDR